MEQANRLKQSDIQLADQRRVRTGNKITQSTAIENIIQRTQETGQLLPSINPFGGVQQKKESYVELPDYSKPLQNQNKENFMGMSENPVSGELEENQVSGIQNNVIIDKYNTAGQLEDILAQMPNYKTKLSPQQQEDLKQILKVIIQTPQSYNEVKYSNEYIHLPILYKIAVTKAAIGLKFKYNMNKK